MDRGYAAARWIAVRRGYEERGSNPYIETQPGHQSPGLCLVMVL